MDALTEDGIETIVVMSSAQVGKTEFLLNAIGYYIDQDPAPIMALQPTLPMGEAFSKDRVAPMLRDTPALAGKVKDPRAKNSNNTLLHKKFPGGHLTICGANSPASLASRPIRVVFADEVDRFPVSAGTEGDPLSLAKKRTATFHNRKIVMTSTPTVRGASRIELAWEDSDQRRYYVPCPECGSMQPLQWKNLSWAKGEDGHWDGSDPWYTCDDCEAKIAESEKQKMLRHGRWTAEAFSTGIAGFHLNELYSPWRRWSEIVEDFHLAKGDTELMRVWTNTSLGETFDESSEGIEPSDVFSRREVYQAEVPQGAVVLTAGIDTQDDRLEVEVFGWGLGEERWSITYRVLWGDPAGKQVWSDLDDLLIRGRFEHESGATLGISAACIDSAGHHTKAVYEYCRTRGGNRIFPIVGRAGFGKAMVSAPSRRRYGRDRRPVALFTLGVDEIKTHIHSKLAVAEPGPGYCHFPLSDEYGEEYFLQLGAEVVKTKMVRGVPRRVWEQTRPRNEALDNNVYGYAAFVLLNPNLQAFADSLAGSAETPAKAKSMIEQRRLMRAPRRNTGFANRWKK